MKDYLTNGVLDGINAKSVARCFSVEEEKAKELESWIEYLIGEVMRPSGIAERGE